MTYIAMPFFTFLCCYLSQMLHGNVPHPEPIADVNLTFKLLHTTILLNTLYLIFSSQCVAQKKNHKKFSCNLVRLS